MDPYDSGKAGFGVIVLVMALGAACVIGLMIWAMMDQASSRYEAKQAAISAQAYAQREEARYEHESEVARLDNKVELVVAESAAHQERLATLAVALAGLNSAEEERLLAYERWWLGPVAWFVAVAGAIVVGAATIRVLNPYLDRWISAREEL